MAVKTCPSEETGVVTRAYDPLAAVPLVPENVEMKRDSHGALQLRLTMPLAGLKKKLATWLRYDYTRKMELDLAGTCYYDRVDGVRTLREIAECMAAQLGRDRVAIEGEVISFTKMLMQRNLIALKVNSDQRACCRT